MMGSIDRRSRRDLSLFLGVKERYIFGLKEIGNKIPLTISFESEKDPSSTYPEGEYSVIFSEEFLPPPNDPLEDSRTISENEKRVEQYETNSLQYESFIEDPKKRDTQHESVIEQNKYQQIPDQNKLNNLYQTKYGGNYLSKYQIYEDLFIASIKHIGSIQLLEKFLLKGKKIVTETTKEKEEQIILDEEENIKIIIVDSKQTFHGDIRIKGGYNDIRLDTRLGLFAKKSTPSGFTFSKFGFPEEYGYSFFILKIERGEERRKIVPNININRIMTYTTNFTATITERSENLDRTKLEDAIHKEFELSIDKIIWQYELIGCVMLNICFINLEKKEFSEMVKKLQILENHVNPSSVFMMGEFKVSAIAFSCFPLDPLYVNISDEMEEVQSVELNSISHYATGILLDNPSVNALDNGGRTPLDLASEYGDEATVKILLDKPSVNRRVRRLFQRFRYLESDVDLLESVFKKQEYPNQKMREIVAEKIGRGCTEENVKLWYQNRRSKLSD